MERFPNMLRPACLESWAARIGVAGLVGLSMLVGFRFWADRGDLMLAWLTVCAELIAFAGLSVGAANWRPAKARSVAAFALTALAAAWCGFTMAEKIAGEARADALAAAEGALAYQTAAADLEAASRALRAKLAAETPTGLPAPRLAAWEASQARAIADLRAEAGRARQALAAATPPPSIDWLALARGAAVEIIKLFGFVAFALGQARPRAAAATVTELRPGAALARLRWAR